MTCYILRLNTPIVISYDNGFDSGKTVVAEIQLVPKDDTQDTTFEKADGTVITAKGEIITGDTAWYIRDFGMANITVD